MKFQTIGPHEYAVIDRPLNLVFIQRLTKAYFRPYIILYSDEIGLYTKGIDIYQIEEYASKKRILIKKEDFKNYNSTLQILIDTSKQILEYNKTLPG